MAGNEVPLKVVRIEVGAAGQMRIGNVVQVLYFCGPFFSCLIQGPPNF